MQLSAAPSSRLEALEPAIFAVMFNMPLFQA